MTLKKILIYLALVLPLCLSAQNYADYKLYASYDFEQGVIDRQANTSLELKNGARIVEDAVRGKVLYFSGDKCQHAVMVPAPVMGDTMSLSFWYKRSSRDDSKVSWKQIFEFYNSVDGSNIYFMPVYGFDDSLSGVVCDARTFNSGVWEPLYGPCIDANDAWHHVVLVVHETSWSYYLDGEKVGTKNIFVSLSLMNLTHLFFGMNPNRELHPSTGSIDDINIYHYPLSQSQVSQIYAENLCMVATSMLIIWMLIEVTAGLFATVYSIPVKPDLKFDLLLSLIILFGLPLITSIYPFLRYNYSSPITSLRSVSVGGHSIVSRAFFLFVQYIITFCLIVVSLYFVRQLYTMLHADLGYRAKDIISCQFLSHETQNRRYASDEEWQKEHDLEQHKEQVIKQKMNACPLFVTWSYGEIPINLEPYINLEADNGEKHKVALMNADKEYMDMFGLKLKEGREWNDKDQFAQYKMIINETAKKLFQIKNIEEASLQPESRLWWSMGIDEGKNPPFEIVGVIEDFRTGHLAKGDAPLAILYDKGDNPTNPLIATIVEGKRKEAVDFLKELHDEVLGQGEFDYSFVEDEVKKLYDEDKRATQIYVTFAGLAICISCLGLFGLSLYDIRQRYREIALRKVNGATGKQVALLLVRKYLYILGAAFAVAIPLAYYIIHDYTKDFTVKAPVGVDIFITGFILTLIISLGTLLWQVRRAVRINPALIMKSE